MTIVLLSLAAVGVLALWTRGSPERGLYAAIFCTGFLMTPELPIVREKLAAPEICMLWTWALMVFGRERSTRPMLDSQRRALVAGGIFLAFATLSWAINLGAASRGQVASTVEMVNYAYGFLVMLTVVHLVNRWDILENCLWAWLAGALVVSAIGALAVVGAAPSWAYDDFTGRVSATLKFENQVPSFLLPILPVAVVFAAARSQLLHRRLALAGLALAGILTIAMTGSRAGLLMIALLLGGVLWIAMSERDRPYLNAKLVFAAFAVLVAAQIGLSTLALALYDGNYRLGFTPAWQRPTVTLYEWLTARGGSLGTIDGSRVDQAALIADNWVDHALIGIGPKMVGPVLRSEEIHNTYLGVLIETGLPGLSLFLIFIAMVMTTGFQLIGRCNSDIRRAMIRALLVGFALLLFYQLANFGLRQRNLWIVMGLIVALPRALGAFGTRAQVSQSRRPETRGTIKRLIASRSAKSTRST